MLGWGRADRPRSRRQTGGSEVWRGEANEGWGQSRGQRRRDALVSEGGSETKQPQLSNNSNRTRAEDNARKLGAQEAESVSLPPAAVGNNQLWVVCKGAEP